MNAPANAHPAIVGLLRHFGWEHLPPHLQGVSRPFADLAHELAERIPSGAELTTSLRKLLEAKDCAVRAYLDGQRADPDAVTVTVHSPDGPLTVAAVADALRRAERRG